MKRETRCKGEKRQVNYERRDGKGNGRSVKVGQSKHDAAGKRKGRDQNLNQAAHDKR